MQRDSEFLATEKPSKLLLKLALPAVTAQLVNMLYNIVDRIYIGHIPEVGSSALTGVGVCLPIILIVSAFACFTASGGAPRASIYMGRDYMDSAEKTLGGCFTLQIGISVVLTAVLLLWGARRSSPSARAKIPLTTPRATCIFMHSARSLSSSRWA